MDRPVFFIVLCLRVSPGLTPALSISGETERETLDEFLLPFPLAPALKGGGKRYDFSFSLDI